MSDHWRIDRYLKELREALRFPPPLEERVLTEVEDHLREGTERGQARGLPSESAQERAIARFGTTERLAAWLADEYAAEIATPPLLNETLTRHGGTTMWQRFTERARRAVYFAQEEAARCATFDVGTEHLLIGLVREHDTVAADVLMRMRIPASSILPRVLAQLTRGTEEDVGKDTHMQLTGDAKRSIDLAFEEAQSLGMDYIGTEHLLLGLIREEEGVGGRILVELGADPDRAREATLAVLEHRAKWTPDPVTAAWRIVEEARRRLAEAESIHSALLKASTAGALAPSAVLAPAVLAPGSPASAAPPSDAVKEQVPTEGTQSDTKA